MWASKKDTKNIKERLDRIEAKVDSVLKLLGDRLSRQDHDNINKIYDMATEIRNKENSVLKPIQAEPGKPKP